MTLSDAVTEVMEGHVPQIRVPFDPLPRPLEGLRSRTAM